MEKLIELLNEYDKEKGLHTFWKTTQSNKIQIYGKGVCSESYLYSKSYGFIKWLVENDKIDRDKELKENGLFREYFYDLEYVKNYDRLVMWLSVEDEPINFLISILK